MLGNVDEWCLDWYAPYPAAPVTDPVGPAYSFYKVLRGGDWYLDAGYVRSAKRLFVVPDNRRIYMGFRLARSSP